MTPTTPGNDDVAAAYDCWSEVYDTDANATRDLDATALRQQQLELDGATVLEVGCGTGKNTEWLATFARSVLALDLSEGMLRKARARVGADHVRFVRHDLRERWPVADGSFQVVVADLVLEHVEVLQSFFDEAARVLEAGGRLFFAELHPLKQLSGSQARFTVPGSSEVRLVRAHRHSVSEYLNAGLAAGLRLLRVDEWCDDDAPAGAPPRLLSMVWER